MVRAPIAEAGEPDAEIGVLGDVVGVPAADALERGAAEMVGGAAERQRHAQRGERRQQPVEQRRILDGEEPRDPARRRIVDDDRRLQAGEARVAGGEGGVGFAKLARMRPVLGVVDRHQLAAREGQREGERLRLGARHRRRGRRRSRRAAPGTQLAAAAAGLGIVRLDDELDVELVARPVDAVAAPARARRPPRLPGRAARAPCRRGGRVGSACRRRTRPPGENAARGDEAEQRDAEEERAADIVDGHQRRRQVEAKRQDEHRRGRRRACHLARVSPPARAERSGRVIAAGRRRWREIRRRPPPSAPRGSPSVSRRRALPRSPDVPPASRRAPAGHSAARRDIGRRRRRPRMRCVPR